MTAPLGVGCDRAILSARWIESQLVGSQRDGCSDARAARLEAARLLALRRRPRAGPPDRLGAVAGDSGRAGSPPPPNAPAPPQPPPLLPPTTRGSPPPRARGR